MLSENKENCMETDGGKHEQLGVFQVAQWVKNLPATHETWRYGFNSWVGKIPWKRAWQSSILAWIIPWTEEPDGLQSTGHRESDTTEVTEHMDN